MSGQNLLSRLVMWMPAFGSAALWVLVTIVFGIVAYADARNQSNPWRGMLWSIIAIWLIPDYYEILTPDINLWGFGWFGISWTSQFGWTLYLLDTFLDINSFLLDGVTFVIAMVMVALVGLGYRRRSERHAKGVLWFSILLLLISIYGVYFSWSSLTSSGGSFFFLPLGTAFLVPLAVLSYLGQRPIANRATVVST